MLASSIATPCSAHTHHTTTPLLLCLLPAHSVRPSLLAYHLPASLAVDHLPVLAACLPACQVEGWEKKDDQTIIWKVSMTPRIEFPTFSF